MSTIDWATIKEEYEQGKSQNLLAKKHGVSQPAISKYAKSHNWTTPQVIPPQETVIPPITIEDIESNTVIISLARRMLGLHMLNNPDPKDLKMLMDSFSQINKIELLAPAPEQEYGTGGDLHDFLAELTDEELSVVRPILAAYSARKAQADEQKITPLRKNG